MTRTPDFLAASLRGTARCATQHSRGARRFAALHSCPCERFCASHACLSTRFQPESIPTATFGKFTFFPMIFLDGYCSTVQGLLDWFEVDLGFTELLFI